MVLNEDSYAYENSMSILNEILQEISYCKARGVMLDIDQIMLDIIREYNKGYLDLVDFWKVFEKLHDGSNNYMFVRKTTTKKSLSKEQLNWLSSTEFYGKQEIIKILTKVYTK